MRLSLIVVVFLLSGCAGEAVVKCYNEYDDDGLVIMTGCTESRRIVRT